MGYKDGIMKIGIAADTHYDIVEYPARTSVAEGMVGFFNSNSVEFILHLGDIYNHFGGADIPEKEQCCLDSFAQYEPVWAAAGAQSYWLMGNHDHFGVDNEFFISNSKFTPALNFVINRGGWRFICYSNKESFRYNASAESLVWLEKQLELARLDQKKVIICTHCRILQFYPGNPASWTAEPASMYSVNSDEQLRIIDRAQEAGTDIRYVFVGHAHGNAENIRNGVTFYAFKNGGDDGACAVVEIQGDDSLVIIGRASQTSFNV